MLPFKWPAMPQLGDQVVAGRGKMDGGRGKMVAGRGKMVARHTCQGTDAIPLVVLYFVDARNELPCKPQSSRP